MTLETNSNLSVIDTMVHTNKSKAVSVLVAVFVFTVNTETEAKPVNATKPNIIIIMPDDSGYGNHSCFGNPVIKTPNIDALKKESLLLTRYHSSARCSPSRAKLMSGRHEFLGGVTDTRFMPLVFLASGTWAMKGLTVPRIAGLMLAGFTKRAQE